MNFMEEIAQSPEDVKISWEFTRMSCMHCDDPACVHVCPTNAISQLQEGPVIIDQSQCMGCKYCAQACPFHVPRFNEEQGVVFKCTMCADRVGVGGLPACVKSCVAGALSFDDKETILSQAKVRAAKINGIIYGEKEAGGTNVIYVLPRPAGELGLREPSSESAGSYWRSLLTKISAIGLAGAAAFGVLGFIIGRRDLLMSEKEE
jgi:formate dehydrogenase iron-sulfur subunit